MLANVAASLVNIETAKLRVRHKMCRCRLSIADQERSLSGIGKQFNEVQAPFASIYASVSQIDVLGCKQLTDTSEVGEQPSEVGEQPSEVGEQTREVRE
jgi:hypothetical protein